MRKNTNVDSCLGYTNYGKTELTIGDKMSKKKISCYKMSVLTGLRYEVVKRYSMGELIRVDLDVLARIVYILQCNINDILLLKSEMEK